MSTTPPSKGSTKGTAKAGDKADKAEGGKKRAARQDYGFAKDAIIRVKLPDGVEADKKFRGQRLDWFNKLNACNGKTCQEFLDKNKGKDSPRGWLRFFVADAKVATLEAAKKAA